MPLPLIGAAATSVIGGALLPGGAPAGPRRVGLTPEVSVEGLTQFRRDLKRLDRELDRDLRLEIRKAAATVAAEAAAAAPRQSGALAKSIRPYVAGANVSVGSTLPYAGVVHFGGTIQPRGTPITFKPTEFISHAVDRSTDRLVDEIGDAIETSALRAGWHR